VRRALSEESKLEVAVDDYVSAARKEELAIESAMIRIAKSDAAIARGSYAMQMFDSLSRLARDLENQLADNLPKLKGDSD